MKTVRSLFTTISILAAMLYLMIASASAASLTLPTSLQVIEEEAFYGDTSLDEVLLPEGVETIGERAFADSSITSIYLPSSINYIAEFAFQNTSVVGSGLSGTYAQEWFESHGLVYLVPSTPIEDFEWETINGIEAKITKYTGSDQRVYVPAMIDDYDIVEISSKAFYGNSTLESITIPSSVRTIKNEAFRNCSSLQDVLLSEGLEYIGSSAFRNCDLLTTFSFPDSVVEMGSYILADCDQLFSTNYPINAATVGEGTFSNDPCMTSFHIEEGITIIHGRFFDNNKYLVDLQFPSTLQTIGPRSFYGCTGLTSIDIPSSVVTIGSYAFYDCTGFTSIVLPDSVTTVNSHAFQKCSALNSVVFSQQLVDIGADAFRECVSLLEANLPDTVEGLGEGAFYDCTSLSSFHYPVSLAHRNSQYDNGYLYDGEIFKNCKNLRTIVVPEGVEVIPSGIFKNANYLRSIELPSTLKEIHKSAFENCIAIRTFTIPDGVEEIRACAFSGCTALTSIAIPDSLAALGERAFAGCILLNSFHYPLAMDHVVSLYDNGSYYEGNIFLNCNKLTTITVPEGVTKIPSRFFKGSNYLTSINLPSTVTLIESHAFENCTAIISLSLPNGLLNVNAAAFAGCTALQSADLPDSVVGLGERAFDGCTSLQSFHYPMNLQYLNSVFDNAWIYEGNVLRNCEGVKEVIIPEGVTHIPDLMFRGANYLETVIVPNSVTTIGGLKGGLNETGQSFGGCTAMEKIYIGPAVTKIGGGTFKNCPNLTVWCEYGSTVLQYCKDNSVNYYYLTPDGVNSPSGTLYQGDSYGLHGYARASIPLTNVTATIWNSDKSETIQTITVAPIVTDYALSGEINYNLLFNSLPLGNYCYTLTASTDLSTEIWADTTFRIVPPPLRVGVSGFSEYSDLVESGSLKLRGTVHSNYSMNSLTIYLLNPSKNAVITKTVSPGSKSYALSNISISLANVASETYTLKVVVNANGETKTALQTPVTINNSTAVPVVTEELREEIIEFLRNKKVGTFNPGTLVDSYFANMSTWDVITMGLSDYNSIALSKFKDWLSGSDYDSYMVEKYQAEIAQLLKDMYDNSEVEMLPLYGTFPKLIKDVGSVLKDTTGYMLDNMNENIDELKIAFGAPGQFEEMEILELLKDIGKGTTIVMKGLKYTDEFVDFLEDVMTDHAQALAALEVIAETYNPNGNPNFSQALSLLKASYKSKLGKTIIEVCKRAANYAMKEANKTITKSVLSLAGASASSLYSLADTAAELVIKYTGLEDIGQDKVDFITQYTSLSTLQGAFDRACSDAIDSYADGEQISDAQINRIQISFVTCRQALIRLYQTTKGLDNKNAAAYDTLINETKNKSMPGVAPIQ